MCFYEGKGISKCKNNKVVMAGDGRYDSPGLSTKNILMDVTDNLILQIVTVDEQQVRLNCINEMFRLAFTSRHYHWGTYH